MKKKIILHGYLKERYPQLIEVEADTVADAILSLQQIPELQPQDGRPYPVRVEGIDTEAALRSKTDLEEIHIFPLTGGSGGRDGLMQVLLGIVLIAVAFFNPLGLLSASMVGNLYMAGGLMLLGGLLQMLTPSPKEEPSSKNLGAGSNTVDAGTPIPIPFGFVKAPGHYLSFNISATDFEGDETDNTPSQRRLSRQVNWDLINDPEVNPYGSTGSGPAPADDDNFYVEIDKVTLLDPMELIDPIFASATPSANNTPTSGWVGA